MASKLDYLKKYMAKPGKASDSTGSVYSSAGGAGKMKSGKDKARRKAQEQASMQIRDMSEALPKPRAEGRKGTLGAQRRGDLGLGGALAAEPEDGLVFVDKDEVEQKSKLNHETSGVAWKISQHRKGKPPGQRGVAARAADSGGGDGDLSPPRRRSGGAGAAAVAAAVAASAPPPAASKGEDSDEDLSLPRAAKSDAKEVKAEPAASDDDLSLPRPDKKSAKPGPGDSDDDLSLPRPDKVAPTSKKSTAAPRPTADGGGGGSDSDDLSLPRKPEASAAASTRPSGRHDSDSDLSPPRGRPAAKEVKKEVGASDDDNLSPPRRDGGSAKAVSSGAKPPRPSGRHDSDSDLSPPRGRAAGKDVKKEKRDSDDDFSPPRRDAGSGKAASSTAKPAGGVGGAGRHDSDSDDLSPPRKGGDGGGDEEEEPEKMSSGLRAGLVRGSVLKEEAAQVRAERHATMMAQSDEQTGRNATTVYRNKQGAKIDREEWVDQQQKKRRKKLSDYPEQELEWGGGVKQQFRKEAEMEELERIAAQPFARYEPDEKYIEELKGKKDWNDPMRKFQDDDEDDDNEEDKRASAAGAGGDVGAAVSAAARKAPKPKCPHAPWPNRFDIPPGYRWDGKVRGSGFEKKWLETKNHRQCVDKERWKWEMEEM